MRLDLAGSLPLLKPVVIVWDANATFDAASYKALGYTNFDVIVIGGGGGRGGNTQGEDTSHPGDTVKTFGGMGGGGGFKRVQGLLSFLPDGVDVIVGGAGANGTDSIDEVSFDPDTSTTDGLQGGYSSFNGELISTPGGYGGLRSISRSREDSSNANGGNGGNTGYTTGGDGGVAGTFEPHEEPTPGADGYLQDGGIFGFGSGMWEGHGGGGGPGGIVSNGGESVPMRGKAGGKGNWLSGREQVYVPGTPAFDDSETEAMGVMPGLAGGARITPLNNSWKFYGRSMEAGVVAIRLTVM